MVMVVLVFACSWFKVQGPENMKSRVLNYNLVFWFESIGVWAFAVSWLVKGKADLMLYRNSGKAAPPKTE